MKTALLALLALAGACHDEVVGDDDVTIYEFEVTKAAEVPLCAAAGASAAGTARVTVNEDNTAITVTNLEFSGLSGAPTMAHLHFGAVGTMGPVVLTFGMSLTSPIYHAFYAVDYPDPVPAGAPADFAAFAAALRNGMVYINVHTDACPAGEIRGHIL